MMYLVLMVLWLDPTKQAITRQDFSVLVGPTSDQTLFICQKAQQKFADRGILFDNNSVIVGSKCESRDK